MADRVREELTKIMNEPGRRESAKQVEDAFSRVSAHVAKQHTLSEALATIPITDGLLAEIEKMIDEEFAYQDRHFQGNDKKPFEVWFLLASQYMREASEAYAHQTKECAKKKLLKSVACSLRALQAK